MEFNIFTQVQKELDEFFASSIHLAGLSNTSNIGLRSQGNQDTNYAFSQWKTLNKIEMYYNSIFESGLLDAEGQRKVFLNICAFRADVAAKQTDIDLKNFVFVPETDESVWPAYFAQKEFRQWAKKNYFSETINQTNGDYSKYGTSVLKLVKGNLENVNLLTLRNQTDALSLATARYVIEEHERMDGYDIANMPTWDPQQLDLSFGKSYRVYERYGYVPLSWYKKQKKEKVLDGDDSRIIDTLAVVVLNSAKKGAERGGTMLFMEKIKSRPYQEVHWKRQNGRWLGVGEIENQFENQIVRNMTANMRRRALMWSTKKVFQSSDTEVQANLVRDVKDGDVLKVDTNGQISQVNVQTQNLSEFQANENMWEENSNQKSFSFEVATGEAMPSGTPFRLGVLLSNAANSHFGLKRENLGLFFKRVVAELLYPQFEKESFQEKILNLAVTEEGIESLRKALLDAHVNSEIKKVLLSGRVPNAEDIRVKTEEDIMNRKQLFIKRPEGFYENMKKSVELEITGESMDIPKKIETFTNIFNTLRQAGDPTANEYLKKIVALTGENMESISSSRQQAPAQQSAGAQIQQSFQQPQALEGQATL